MRGIYLTLLDINQGMGYARKVFGQLQGFRALGVDMELICLGSPNAIVRRRAKDVSTETPLASFANLPFANRVHLFRAALEEIRQTRPDFVYTRYPLCDPLYVRFLSKVRSRWPACVLVAEIPTYPYGGINQQLLGGSRRILGVLDWVSRRWLRRYLDRVAVVDFDGPVLGVPSISIQNGIEVESIRLRRPGGLERDLRLLAAANLTFYHGYDRVLAGLREYAGQAGDRRPVWFELVAPEGDVLAQLRRTARRLGVSECVIFHGQRLGGDLDAVYDRCDVGIGALGWHRTEVRRASELKLREYAARGLPFVYTAEDRMFTADVPYWLRVAADDSPLDIRRVVEFANGVYRDPGVAEKIRTYARERLDWAARMKEVVTEIERLAMTRSAAPTAYGWRS